uniref:Serine protease 23 n=2 Tax=Papio anubis TaxID=9555 RepID=A0A8I5N6F7_PAPAN
MRDVQRVTARGSRAGETARARAAWRREAGTGECCRATGAHLREAARPQALWAARPCSGRRRAARGGGARSVCGGAGGGRAASPRPEAGRAGLGWRGGRTRQLPALLARSLALGCAAGQAWEPRAPSRRPHLSERRSEPRPGRAARRGTVLGMAGIPGLLFLLFLLLCAVGQVSPYSAPWKPTWPAYRLPVVLPQSTLSLAKPDFGAEAKLEVSSSCGPQCHKGTPLPTYEEAKQYLSYETLYANGSRTETQVGIYILSSSGGGAQHQDSGSSGKSRRKRQIYGYDSRFSIFGKDFLLNYPFSTSVKLSTGCTGTLVAEKHVLTAAHCIHDGKTYVKGTQKLRVGFLKPKFKDGGRGANDSTSAMPEKMKFQWIRVKRTHVPKGWIKGNANDIGMDYDYALLELKKPHKRKFMKIGVSPPAKQLPGGRIHFSGYDNDRPGNLVYRFCDVKDETYDLLYQQCDAQPGASGSGVYVRMWKRQQQKWERKIIGIFSGHQWVDMNGSPQDFNVAVRITPLKYAQICYWIKGNYLDCREG